MSFDEVLELVPGQMIELRSNLYPGAVMRGPVYSEGGALHCGWVCLSYHLTDAWTITVLADGKPATVPLQQVTAPATTAPVTAGR